MLPGTTRILPTAAAPSVATGVLVWIASLAAPLVAQPSPRRAVPQTLMFASLTGTPVVGAEGRVVGTFADVGITASGAITQLVYHVRQKAAGAATKTLRVPFADVRYSHRDQRFELRKPPLRRPEPKPAIRDATTLLDSPVALLTVAGDVPAADARFGELTNLWLDVRAGVMTFVGARPDAKSGRADERLAPWRLVRVVPAATGVRVLLPARLETAPRTKTTILRSPQGRARVEAHYGERKAIR